MSLAQLTPDQSHEYMQELLELQLEENELKENRDRLSDKATEAKKAHEAKEKEIISHIKSINQKLPLFDEGPEQVPWREW